MHAVDWTRFVHACHFDPQYVSDVSTEVSLQIEYGFLIFETRLYLAELAPANLILSYSGQHVAGLRRPL